MKLCEAAEMNADEVWMEPTPIQLRIRPLWKRALLAPRTFRRYLRAGCRVRFALVFTWMTIRGVERR